MDFLNCKRRVAIVHTSPRTSPDEGDPLQQPVLEEDCVILVPGGPGLIAYFPAEEVDAVVLEAGASDQGAATHETAAKTYRSYVNGPEISRQSGCSPPANPDRPFASIQAQTQMQSLLRSHRWTDLRGLICDGPQTRRDRGLADRLWDIVSRGVSESQLKDGTIYAQLRQAFHQCRPKAAVVGTSNRTNPQRSADSRAKDIASILSQARRSNAVSPSFAPAAYLDVGCDDGMITAAVGNMLGCKYIHGCDVVPLSVAMAPQDLVYHHYDGINLPFGDACLDVVTANMSLHHMHDASAVLAGVFRALRPGGVFIIREHDCRDELESMVLDVLHGLYALVWSDPQEWPQFCEEAAHDFRSRAAWIDTVANAGFVQREIPFTCQAGRNTLLSYWELFVKPERLACRPRKRAHSDGSDRGGGKYRCMAAEDQLKSVDNHEPAQDFSDGRLLAVYDF